MPGMDAPFPLRRSAIAPHASMAAGAARDVAPPRLVRSVPARDVARAGAADRLASIEILRLLAAFGIVWFHVPSIPGKSVGYAGLPVFLILTFLFVPAVFTGTERRGFLARRTVRLLIPWMLWSALYLPLFVARGIANEWESAGPLWFLAGTAQHLWFLPFAWLFGILAAGLNAELARWRSLTSFTILLLAAFAVPAGLAWLLAVFELPEPLPQWLFALPALPIGLAFAAGRGADDFRRRVIMLMAVTIVTLAGCAVVFPLDEKSLAPTYMIATPVVAAALCLDRWRIGSAAAGISAITLGIYLIHPAVYTVLARVTGTELPSTILAVLVFAVSLGAAIVLVRTPLLQPELRLRPRPAIAAADPSEPAPSA